MNSVKRVLVVEDDVALLDKFATLLKKAGYDVDTAMTKAEALEKVEHRTYHVATLDIMLTDDPNDRGGIEVLKRIRSLNEGTIAIVLSASSDVRVPVEVWAEGAMTYLIKKDIRSSQDIVGKVEWAYNACTLKLFGKYNNINAYLAFPEGRIYFEDNLMKCLSAGGVNDATRALDRVLTPLLPVLRYKKQMFGLNIKSETGVAGGWFWSKALGHAVWVSIARESAQVEQPPLEMPSATPLYEEKGRCWSAAVWKEAIPRQEFADSLYNLE